jgi:type IV fimbrial biogenesis protein FimT
VAKKKSAPVATNALCRPLAGADNGEMSNSDFASQRLPAHRAPRRGGQAGFSLMEVMVVAVIVAIMAVLAVPSLSGMVQRQRVKNAADAVLSDLRWARSEAIKRGQDVTVQITPGTTNWQYTVYETQNQEKKIKTVMADDFPGVSLTKKSSSPSVWQVKFDHIRGTAKNDTIFVENASGDTSCIPVTVSVLGRIRFKSEKNDGPDFCKKENE